MLLLSLENLFSQSCIDSSVKSCLGPNLVTNGDFESGNSAFQSDYKYGLPGNGAYLVMSTDASTINIGWQCTGNPGKYLLGDGYIGANNHKAIWRETISNTKIDSMYVFLIDVNNPIEPSRSGYYAPHITMTINGKDIVTTVINQSPDKWINMCCLWKCDNTTAVIEIFETYGNATGCDFTLDNVYFGRYNVSQTNEHRYVCKDSITLYPNESSNNGYFWSNGDTTRSIKVKSPGSYSVKYSNGCPIEKIFIVSADNPILELDTKDTSVCNSFILTAITDASKVYWSTGDSTKTIEIMKPGSYVAKIRNACNETLTDSITVKFRSQKNLVFPNDSIMCNMPSAFWIRMDPAFKYKFNGVKGDSLFVDKEGPYLIQAYDSCNNELRDTFNLVIREIPTLSLPNDIHFCKAQEAILKITDGFKSLKWKDGQTQSQIVVSKQEPVWIEAVDSCGGIHRDTVMVFMDSCVECQVHIPNAFTPNNDDLDENFFPVFSCPVVTIEFKVFNRWGELLYISYNLDAKWDGVYKEEACPQDVYMFIINAKISNGNIYRYFYKAGTFHLLL